jgi:hypothetical protein
MTTGPEPKRKRKRKGRKAGVTARAKALLIHKGLYLTDELEGLLKAEGYYASRLSLQTLAGDFQAVMPRVARGWPVEGPQHRSA